MRTSTLSVATLSLIAQSLAVYVPSEPWSTLTPSATLASATTNYPSAFAISIDPLPTKASSSALAKRDVVSQIGDGQIQATTKTEAPVVTQIGDGQIQATTMTQAPVVTQIGDGQIQATTKTEAPVVTQIGDGQIQATTKTEAPVVTQIGDGQIQASTATVATQIGDGQIQASTATDKKSEPTIPADDNKFPVSCKNPNALTMKLTDSILTDAHGRIGSIVANRQFQFDGPPPQAGAIYAAGWSISDDGNLAIGNTTVFYQCLSGNFYNLYDEHIGSQCEEVYLKVVDLIDC